MDSLRRLEEIFARFPGIGPRQARRFVYYILNKPQSFSREFTQMIEDVRKSTSECTRCHRFFFHDSKAPLCSVCKDPARDQSILMIVARDSDFETVEKSAAYKGLYFILGGTIPVLDKEPDKRIRLKELLERVSQDSTTLKEIILSMNTTPDGEHTATVVRDAVGKVNKDPQLKVSILGRGLSTGAELEYADSETIKNALRNRE